MRYVAAYLLAVLGGNRSPNSNDIEKILGSVGIEAESDKVSKVIDQLSGKDIHQIVEAGKGKLASMPSGGGAVAAAPAAAGGGKGGGAAPTPAKKEEKKEEVKEEESDEDLGFGLFD